MKALRLNLVLGLFAIGVLAPADLGAGGKKDDDIVAADAISKLYATDGPAFDKQYKGKTITIEGVVTGGGVKGAIDDRSFLMLAGFKKPGDPVAHSVRCVESGPDFEGIRTGHKVQIRGTVQPYKETLLAVELQDCKVVKVFADDYPPSKAARAEVKKLQGKWTITAAENAGKKLDPKKTGFTAISFEGYQVYLHQGDKLLSFGLVLDPEKSPKTMDLIGAGSLPCIYTLDGDTFTLTLPGRNKDGAFARPTGQDTKTHTGLLLQAERTKAEKEKAK